jgi:hypothetical protein
LANKQIIEPNFDLSATQCFEEKGTWMVVNEVEMIPSMLEVY